jgi:hypothetical protein
VALESDFHHSFSAPSHAMNQVPEFGLLKCNVDANWHKGSRNGGFGYVVRDSSGNFVAAKAICFLIQWQVLKLWKLLQLRH